MVAVEKVLNFNTQHYQHFCLDVADEGKVKAMFSEIRKRYGRLDILVNNAAVNLTIGPAMLNSLAAVSQTMETNFLGTYLMSREAAKLMTGRAFGRIINMGSMAVRHEVPGESVYTASKSAVIAFSRTFAKEVHKLGITCNVLAPSAIETELSQQVDRKALSEVLNRNAIPEFGTVNDVCSAIDWLIRPESNAITGQVIYLGGA